MADNPIELFLTEKAGVKVIDSLPVAVFITDLKGRLKHYNSAAVQLSGQEPELGTDQWFVNWNLHYADGTSVPENFITESLEEKHSFAGTEIIAERPDGERIWIRTYSSALNNKEEGMAGGLHIFINITDQKEVEEKLKQNQDELSDLFDNAAIGFHQTKSDGTIKRANKTILDMLGYTREEFVGSHITDYVDPEIVDEVLQKLSAGEMLRNYEIPMKDREGKVRHVILNSNGYWKDGEFLHTQCITQDITPRKKAKAALKNLVEKSDRQERLYEAIISSTPDLVYVFDLNARFIFANDALLEMWGRTREESIGKSLLEVGYEPWHAEMHEREIEQVIATKEPVQGEVTFPHDKLGQRYYDHIFVPVIDDQGEVEAVAGTTRDVTDRKQVEQALRKKEENYRTLVENFPKGAVGLFDKNLRYTAIGGELMDAMDVDPQNRIGIKISDIYPDEIVDEVEPYFWAALDGESNSFETEYRNRHLFAQTLPVKNDEGEVVGGMLVVQDITDRWQAQQDLRTSEEKYRTLFERMDEGFCIIKMEFDDNNEPVNFSYLETNPAFHKHSGLEDKDIEGKSGKEVLPYLGKDLLQRNGQVALTGEPFNDEVYVQEVDRWLDLFAFRIGEPEERKVAVLFNNITARKENELANAYLGAIVDNSEDAIISKDLDGIITSWNVSAERMFGYTAKEAIGQSISLIAPEVRVEEQINILNRIKKGEIVDHFETLRKHKDGSLLDISLNVSPIKNPDGTIIGVSKIARDISERKKAQKKRERLMQQIEAERERLADIFTHAPSAMCLMRGPDHVIEEVNRFFMQYVGSRDVVGKPARIAIPEAQDMGFINLLDQVYKTDQPFKGTDMGITLHRKKGSAPTSEKRYLDYVFQPIHEVDGSVSGVFVQGIDITERKRAKEDLKAINETLEDRVEKRTQALLAYQDQLRSLASELSRAEETQRQQLATELHDNLGQMLALGKMKVNKLQEKPFTKEASPDIDGLKKLIDDAITYTRELTSDLKPPPSIHNDVRASLNWLAEKMAKHGLHVSIEDDGHPKPLNPEIRTTVLQGVRELLFNIIKHTSENEATVRLERNDKELHITVIDNGEGFDLENGTLTPSKEGGYGLFNLKERIDLLGGQFDIETVLGQGTSVSLHVPLTEVSKVAAAEKQDDDNKIYKTNTEKDAEKIKVLLVDDHQMFRNGLRKIIEDQDDIMVVGEAGNGKEAISLSRETLPDVILMDVSMPEMDGIEAAGKITSDMPHVRIIGLSLHDSQKVMQDMRSAGASAYLTKTEAFESLVVTIRAEAKSAAKK